MRTLMLLATVTVALTACRRPLDAEARSLQSPTPSPITGVVTVETVASGLEHPWALDFLPDGRIVVTERPGRLRIVDLDGNVSAPIAGLPAVHAQGQGGLLDVAVDPDFETTGLVYFTFAEPGEGGVGTAAARAKLGESSLTELQVIYSQRPKLSGNGHFGSRIVFASDGTLFITQGDRQSYRDRAQDLSQGMGKVVRINRDGSIPGDNPFVSRADAQPEIWSYGHRNLQGAARHPESGALWTVEHGARGGDELNHPEAGKNYGWPVITYGRDYSGLPIGEGTARDGMEQPVYFWDPVIAPSGLAFNTSTRYPGWQGSLLIGSLTPGCLVRLELRDGRVVHEERHLAELNERIRDVVQGPDGYLYLVTDNAAGRILRVVPVSP